MNSSDKYPSSGAWTDWKNSPEGQGCLDDDILKPGSNSFFLENRLWAAFMAAWKSACRRLEGDGK